MREGDPKQPDTVGGKRYSNPWGAVALADRTLPDSG